MDISPNSSLSFKLFLINICFQTPNIFPRSSKLNNIEKTYFSNGCSNIEKEEDEVVEKFAETYEQIYPFIKMPWKKGKTNNSVTF